MIPDENPKKKKRLEVNQQNCLFMTDLSSKIGLLYEAK
jgi:hypothetical protein